MANKVARRSADGIAHVAAPTEFDLRRLVNGHIWPRIRRGAISECAIVGSEADIYLRNRA
jgi:hypothetical protein